MLTSENESPAAMPANVPEKTPAEQLAELENEYALLNQKYEALQKRNILEKVCFESGCTDPDYLQFCAERQGVNLEDAEALRQFAGEFSASAPGCFHARIIPGSSAGMVKSAPSSAGTAEEVPAGDRIALIALSIDNAPDAVGR
ncbi:MAG: hypothetical protein E7053_00245 [Lentisphaerae bacterium]|nr:hypothetical protein [Lentisphaerota bacterium]